MTGRRNAAFVAVLLGAAHLWNSPAHAQSLLRCGPFTDAALDPPAPRQASWPVQEFEKINDAIKTQPYRVLFLGDSLTERFATDAPKIWLQHMAPRGVLNAGVSGDRTEHLLWRLQHGHLDGPPPTAVVLLIGTNDVGHERPPEIIAEGIRADLLYLRQRLPAARIGLLGLWPRGMWPDSALRQAILAVNRLIGNCGDDRWVFYADIGGVLLDPEGRLAPEISPDRTHFSALGYIKLVPRLDALIDRLLARR
jgi:lysophospholipase L1-like esterase